MALIIVFPDFIKVQNSKLDNCILLRTQTRFPYNNMRV